MKTTSRTGPKRRRHFPTAQPKSLLFLAMLLLVLAFLQNVPWVVSNDFGQRLAGSRGSRPEFRYMPVSDTSRQNQMLTQSSALYGKAGPSAAADGDWNDDTLIVDDGLLDIAGVAVKSARGLLRAAFANSSWRGSRSEGGNPAATAEGGSFFVPLSDLPNGARGGYILTAGGNSNVTYAGGSVVDSTSSGTALAGLTLVSP